VADAGIAYFVATMIFDQSESRGPNEMTFEIESLGGYLSVSPSHDYAYFGITVPASHFDVALDILADGTMNAVFGPARVEQHKQSALGVLSSLREKPIERVNWRFAREMQGDHPYGRPQQGTSETIQSLTSGRLTAWHRERYVANNMLIVVAGNLDPRESADRVSEAFAGLEAGARAEPLFEPAVWPDHAVRVTEYGDVNRAYQIVGFPGPDVDHEGAVAMDILLMILGRGRSSRLNTTLVEELDLVAGVSAGFYTKRQTSPIFVWMELPPENTTAAENATVELFQGLAETPVDEAELSKAKALLESEILFARETAQGQASFYGYWTTIGGPGFGEEYLDRMRAVTADDIRSLAREHFAGTSHAAVAVLPEWAR